MSQNAKKSTIELYDLCTTANAMLLKPSAYLSSSSYNGHPKIVLCLGTTVVAMLANLSASLRNFSSRFSLCVLLVFMVDEDAVIDVIGLNKCAFMNEQ